MKQLVNGLDGYLREEITAAEIELAKPRPKPKTNIKELKEKQRRLTVAYMAGNKTDKEYLQEDAELKSLIAKAEKTAPPEPRNIQPLKDLLESDFKSIYESLTEEEKQLFWTKLIKEIKLDGKQIKRVVFF